jgi:hypothetical protein
METTWRRHVRYPKGPIYRCGEDLDSLDPQVEEVKHLATARVVIAEYEILQHDFPELSTDALVSANSELADLTPTAKQDAVHAIIDEWLVVNAAFVSAAQAKQDVVNTAIVTDGATAVAVRPRTYGRALVMPIQNVDVASRTHRRWARMPGLLDLKGTGVGPNRIPSHRQQSNGLEYLSTALHDLLIKKAIDEACAQSAPTIWTVPVYAVLDLGFDVRVPDSERTLPAGMHVRRAHRRPLPGVDELRRHDISLHVEKLLRSFGMTTASGVRRMHITREGGRIALRIGDTPWPMTAEGVGICLFLLERAEQVSLDRPDVQLARDMDSPAANAQILDFGAIRVEQRFAYPISTGSGVTLDRICWPDEPGFIQPDPARALPLSSWNRPSLSRLCTKLAWQFRHDEISRVELRRTLEEPLDSLVH